MTRKKLTGKKMATKTAVRPEHGTAALVLLAGAKAIGRVIAHNPVIAGGTTAFTVSMLFFSSNALWYQPYAQKHAFFQTRATPFIATKDKSPATTGSIGNGDQYRSFVKAPANPVPTPATTASGGDPVVARVQGILARLKLYSGEIDGLSGPQTRSAIQAYQQIMGLEPSGEISDALLRQLDPQGRATASAPVPTPAPRSVQNASDASVNATHASLVADTTPTEITGDAVVVKVQAGLRAFGNDRIQLDGVLGDQTQAAIREFQSLFGLPVTGQIDDQLIAKMEEVGLIGN
jgi:peptidoglycan hydrolase-like protein with peptidoglycan-binding domain